MNEPGVFVGLDVGTSGVRAVAVDALGHELASFARSLPSSVRNSAGASRQDPEDWWSAVQGLLGDVAQALLDRPVRCLAVDGTSATLLLCDRQGRPLTPALMYDDVQSRSLLPRIASVAPPEVPVHGATSSLAKLLRLEAEVPAERGVLALHQADWLLGRLCGRFGVSDENNCLKLGYDAERRRWPDWLSALGVRPERLPEVYPAGTLIAPLAPAVSDALGFPRSCLIATGTTDSTAAAIAAGISTTGQAVSSLGSTLVLKVLADKPLFVPEYGIYSHRLGDLWLVGGASNAGGAVLAQFFTPARMQELSEAVDPESPTGLDYYPLARPGERFPINDPDFLPRLTPRPASDAVFFQALLEGLTEIERLGYRLLQKFGAPYPERVLSMGGGAGNEAWRTLRIRRLGVPVLRAVHQEAAFGSAILARSAFAGRAWEKERWPLGPPLSTG